MRRISPLLVTVSLVLVASVVYGQFNIQPLSQVSLAQMGAADGNDIWGWTDPQDNKEYALVGLDNATAFVDVTNPSSPNYLGRLPSHTDSSIWRDIKVYENHAYIVSDGNGPHGMQIFDLTNLRGVTSPQTFSETAHDDSFRNAHNIAINEERGLPTSSVRIERQEGCTFWIFPIRRRRPLPVSLQTMATRTMPKSFCTTVRTPTTSAKKSLSI